MLRGEGTEIIEGVTPEDVFHFVLDDTQYSKADTKIVSVTTIADTEDGMIAIEEGRFFGMRGSVVTRYRWVPFKRIDVTLVHGRDPEALPLPEPEPQVPPAPSVSPIRRLRTCSTASPPRRR